MNGKLYMKGGTVQGGESTGNYGGNIYVAANKIFEMTGGTVTGGKAKLGGGNIFAIGKVTISNGEVSNGVVSAGGGGNLLVDVTKTDGVITAAGSATISGGTFSYGSGSAQGGSLRVNADATLKITGGTFQYGGINHETKEVTATKGGNLVILSESCTITGGTFIGGQSTEHGGNIRAGKNITLGKGVVLQEGKSKVGGNISNESGGTITIAGADIIDGVATGEGGNIHNASAKTINMTSGTVSGGKASNGGNVISYGDFLMSGGQILDGTATARGGNVQAFRGNSGTFTMSGDALVSGGAASYGGNFFLGGSLKNGENPDMRWGTLILNGGTITGGKATGTYEAGANLGCGGNIAVCERGYVQINGGTVENGEAKGVGGNIFMGNYPTAKLDITGGTITGGKAVNGGNLYISAGVTSKPDDADYGQGYATITGGTISNGEATKTGANLQIEANVTCANATITGGTGSNGIAAHVGAGSLTMTGCTVSNAHASGNGGAFFVGEGMSLSMTDCKISDCSTKANGAAIFAYLDSTVTLNNVEVSNCSADQKGGSIFNAGTMTITDGSITGGKGAVGGNIYTKDSLTLGNVTIDDGEATGGITIAKDGTVSGNGDRTYGGGNIYMEQGQLNIQEGTTIADGTTRFANGGNLYVDVGTVNMTGGVISGGDSITNNKNASGDYKCGGNVALQSAAIFNISSGTVTGGTAHEGGNIRVGHTSTLHISGNALIEKGSAANGGNINSYGMVNMSGGQIADGTASSNGGNVQCFRSTSKTNDGVFTMTGGTITGGTAGKNGGNVYVSGTNEITSYFVLEDGTVTGGNATLGKDFYANNLGNITVKGGTANDIYVISHSSDVGGTLTLEGDPTIETLFVDNDNHFTVDVSQLTCTDPIAVSVTKDGAFAASTTDKSACFTCESAYQIAFQEQKMVIAYPQDVYVSATGDDQAAGTEAAPVQTFAKALEIVADGGTIHLVGVVDVSGWEGHGKSITVTGGEMNLTGITTLYLGDSVHFTDMTIRFPTEKDDTPTNSYDKETLFYVYCNGYKTVFDKDITVLHGSSNQFKGIRVHLYGGTNQKTLASTDLTVLAGTWGYIYGGSNSKNITGDVHLTVGGTVNSTVNYVSHTYSARYLMVGGSRTGNIDGTVYMNVTGGTHTSTHGGSIGKSGSTYTIGNIEMHVTGGEGMAIYCGGRTGPNQVTGEANLYYEGGKYEQVFGAGLTSLEGTLNLYVTGGQITRRLYGGSYNDSELNNQVHGIVNLYIGKDANLSLNYDSDRGIFAHSRHDKTVTEIERTRIIFLDKAAYDTHKSKLGAIDWGSQYIMGNTPAADYICYLGTNASGNVITVGATEVNDYVSNALDLPAATATITVEQDSYIYEGTPIAPATVTYSDNWTYGELPISYANNDKAGTATASVSYNGVTASTSFAIQAAAQPVAQVGETQYTTLAEAIANANGNAVVLLADCGDVTVESDLYVDLNGFHLTGMTVAEGSKLYLIDSATDDYQGAYGTAVVSGAVESYVAYHGKNYLVVSENGVYSAHCYEVKLTHISLKPSDDALGYKAQLLGDEIVYKHVKSFGFNLGVAGGLSKTYSKGATDFDGSFTLRLKGILAANGGQLEITGSAFVIFDIADHTETTDAISTTMKQVLETINASFDSFDSQQQAAVKEMVIKYASKLEGWDIHKILPEE